MKKQVLTILFVLGMGIVSYAQTIKYSPNYYKLKFDAAAGTAIPTAWPYYTAPSPSGIWLAEQVNGAMRIKGDPSGSGNKAQYGVNFQWLISNESNTQTQIATPSSVPNSKKFEIRMKSVGTYTPQVAIQIQDGTAPYRTINHLANITPTSTMTTYVVDLTNQLHDTYGGSPGPLDSLKINQIFLGVDHGVATSFANRQNVDLQIEYFKIGDSTTYVAPPSEIAIQHGATDVPSGSSYDFGTVPNGSSGTPVSLTILNLGLGDLNLTSTPIIVKSGTDASMFSINQSSVASPIAGNGYAYFYITFSPTSAGSKSATITIANNDSDEGTYTINLTGTASVVLLPEINVKQATTNVLTGDTYDMGSVASGSSGSAVTFTIENTGTGDLTISGPPKIVNIGTDATMFTVNEVATTSPVTSGSTTTFTVTFSPTSAGSKTTTISISNNDTDEGIYQITLTGTGTSTTGISEALNDFISVYPNPATNLMTISTNGLEGSLKLSLKNQFGVEVKQMTTMASSNGTNDQVDISDLASGIYYLEVISSKGNGMKKIVKK